jgi:competence protein ComEA
MEKTNLKNLRLVGGALVLLAAVALAGAAYAGSSQGSKPRIEVERSSKAVAATPAPAIRLAERATPRKTAMPTTTLKSGKVLRGLLNLNTASISELQRLPGVGLAKAERVVAWRKTHGKFGRIVDLRRVKGFGPKSVAKLKPHLALDGPTTLSLN